MGTENLGRKLSCGCILGSGRCFNCRSELDPDQEIALEIRIGELKREHAAKMVALRNKRAERKLRLGI